MIKPILITILFCVPSIKIDAAIPIYPTPSTPMLVADVMKAALNNPLGNFVNYKIEGICIWEHMDGFVPVFTTTLWVGEFLPDAVVSVYQHDNENPWDYGRNIIDPVLKKMGNQIIQVTMDNNMTQADQSTDGQGSGNGIDVSNKFKDVDIVGDPAVKAVESIFPGQMIPSQAVPFNIYYSSLSDAYMWRNPEIEMLRYAYYLPPFVRLVGSQLDSWGKIFPRYGFVAQPGDFKAAAVLALRAADITTNLAQPHVYQPLGNSSCGQNCQTWPSKENDWDNVKYQEIYPEVQITAANDFGANDILNKEAFNQHQYEEGNGNYVWVMWRHYDGCIQGDGWLVKAVKG